jgi:membrane protein
LRTTGLREQLASRILSDRRRADLDRLAGLAEREPLRTLRASILGFNRNNDLLWASALTYTSSLSLIPILALALSALKGLGGIDRIRPLIEHTLAVNSPEITEEILNLVGNLSGRALGEVGGAVLLVTVVLTLGTIEQAFNTIFNAERGRTWLRKFSDYLSVTFTVPLLLGAAMPVRATLLAELPQVPGAAWLVSSLMVWAGFMFLYVFFPNTRVRWKSALIGSFVASIMLQVGQWGYIRFQVGAGRYQAVYGAIAAIPILLTWIYIAWVIVLYGAELTAAAQRVEPVRAVDYRSPGFVRTAALVTAFRTGQRMMNREAPLCTLHGLALELGAPESALAPVIARLKSGGIIVEGADSPSESHELFLARDSNAITIAEVVRCLEITPANLHGDHRVALFLEGLSAIEQETLGSLTVHDLVCGRIAASPANQSMTTREQ